MEQTKKQIIEALRIKVMLWRIKNRDFDSPAMRSIIKLMCDDFEKIYKFTPKKK